MTKEFEGERNRISDAEVEDAFRKVLEWIVVIGPLQTSYSQHL